LIALTPTLAPIYMDPFAVHRLSAKGDLKVMLGDGLESVKVPAKTKVTGPRSPVEGPSTVIGPRSASALSLLLGSCRATA
jgi:hypothetical protein